MSGPATHEDVSTFFIPMGFTKVPKSTRFGFTGTSTACQRVEAPRHERHIRAGLVTPVGEGCCRNVQPKGLRHPSALKPSGAPFWFMLVPCFLGKCALGTTEDAKNAR